MTPELLSAREWQARAAKVPACGRASVGFWSVLRAVADRADFDTGRNARPSWDTIQTAAKVSRPVVERALRVGLELGLLAVEEKAHRRPTTYRLAWPSALSLQSLGLQVQQALQSLRETQARGGDSSRAAETLLSPPRETPPIRKPQEEKQQQEAPALGAPVVAAAASPPPAEKTPDPELVALRALVAAHGERLERLERELVALRLRASEAPEAPARPATGRQEESRQDRETPAPRAAQPQDAGVGALLADLGSWVTPENAETARQAAAIAVRRPVGADRQLAAVAAALRKPPGYFAEDAGKLGRIVGGFLWAAEDGGLPEAEVAELVAAVRSGTGQPGKPVALSPEDVATLRARSALADRLALSGRFDLATVIRRENDQARSAGRLSDRMASLGTDEAAIRRDLEARVATGPTPKPGPTSGLVADVLGALGNPGRPALRLLPREAV